MLVATQRDPLPCVAYELLTPGYWRCCRWWVLLPTGFKVPLPRHAPLVSGAFFAPSPGRSILRAIPRSGRPDADASLPPP